jgi:acetylglutamate kinase
MRVAKIGGRAQADPDLATILREAWEASRGELCVVHGGGDEVSAMQRALGREAVFVG